MKSINLTISTNEIFNRSSPNDELSASTFNTVMSATVVFGLMLFAAFGSLSARVVQAHLIVGRGALAYLLTLVILFFVGAVASTSRAPARAVVGLALNASSLGALFGPVANYYQRGSIIDIALGTALLTIVLGAAGALYPRSLEKWGGILCLAVSGLFLVQLSEVMRHPSDPAFRSPTSWIGVIIFSASIVYDFNRAQLVARTIPNAIQCGIAIFVDVVNIFLRLLRVLGRREQETTGSST